MSKDKGTSENFHYNNIEKKDKNFMYKNFKRSNCYNCNFMNSKFDFACFRGAHFKTCSFIKGSFEGTEFIGTNLKNSKFKIAKFKTIIYACQSHSTLAKDLADLEKNYKLERIIGLDTSCHNSYLTTIVNLVRK